MNRLGTVIIIGLLASLIACKGKQNPDTGFALTVNEVVASNDGVSIDETGQTEDWFELVNRSETTVDLQDYAIADSGSQFIPLPQHLLEPGEVILFWADDQPEEGAFHLPFKISAGGDSLTLKRLSDGALDTLNIPELATNQSYARFPSGSGTLIKCRYATANRTNGERCESHAAPTVSNDIEFAPFTKTQWPNLSPAGLAINELNIGQAAFVELKNFSGQAISLSHYALVLAPFPPQAGLPSISHPNQIMLPNTTLGAGEIIAIPLGSTQTLAVEEQAFNEAVAVLYLRETQAAIDSLPFMHWPEQASLSRTDTAPYTFRFCHTSTPGQADNCEPVLSRTIVGRSRGLYTPSDFSTLANGTGKTNVESVKFIIDIDNNNAKHFPVARDWPLHYTFVREVIDGDPPLDRCNAQENSLFNAGWSRFSSINYSSTTNRRYHLGTLSNHANANLYNVEFTFGDAISAQQMHDVFYQITAVMPDPYIWSLRPQDAIQVNRVQGIEGTLPLVGPSAPFSDLVFQGLTPGTAYGTLMFVPTEDLESTTLGNRVIVITNDVPNDIDFVAGLITETFQTPLAHVNLLSQSRNTPNMALPNASELDSIKPLLGKLVRLEVDAGGYQIQQATLNEAEQHWAQQSGSSDVLEPRLDEITQSLQDLTQSDIRDIPTIGAKAAQLAEIMSLDQNRSQCAEGANFAVPEGAFAIPMYHYLEHMRSSGAQQYLETLLADEDFLADLAYRKVALQSLQQLVLQHPVDSALLNEVETWVASRFGNKRVRFRSSSNTEDLQEFNGAGLYTSISAELDDDDRPVDHAIRTVWSSLWNPRAFEERHYSNVNQTRVAMGILVHRAFTNERANGVAVARNVLSPLRTDQYYINSQAGEASVTNPAPGVITEELVYQWPPRTPTLTYHSYSNLLDQTRVLSAAETRSLACSMSSIQTHFKELLDPLEEDRWFTMESEFKFLGAERTLLIKQARPYKLNSIDVPNDCREI